MACQLAKLIRFARSTKYIPRFVRTSLFAMAFFTGMPPMANRLFHIAVFSACLLSLWFPVSLLKRRNLKIKTGWTRKTQGFVCNCNALYYSWLCYSCAMCALKERPFCIKNACPDPERRHFRVQYTAYCSVKCRLPHHEMPPFTPQRSFQRHAKWHVLRQSGTDVMPSYSYFDKKKQIFFGLHFDVTIMLFVAM